MYQRRKCPYSYFRKRWSLILGCFFPVSILKSKCGEIRTKNTLNTGTSYAVLLKNIFYKQFSSVKQILASWQNQVLRNYLV